MDDALLDEETGFLMGLALLGGAGQEVDSLAEPARSRCRKAWQEWRALDREARVAALARMAAAIAAPVPVGIERLHPSWIRERLEGEPAGLVAAVVADLPAAVREAAADLLRARGEAPEAVRPWAPTPEVLAEVQRLLFGPLVDLCVAGPDLPGGVLERHGARVLGHSLAGAPAEARARACAAVGPAHAAIVEEAAAARIDPQIRERARAWVAAASMAQGRTPQDTPEDRLRTLGIPPLADELLEDGIPALRRAAGRLPRDLGLALLRRLDPG